MDKSCEVCLEETTDQCPLCGQIYCKDCSDGFDKAILESADSSKYPKCINPKCDFIHTISIINDDLKILLLKRTLEIESNKLEETGSKVHKEKQLEEEIKKVDRKKEELISKLPKSLGVLGKTYIKNGSQKTDLKKKIMEAEVIFIKPCPLDYCYGFITDKYTCTKCDLILCSKCEENMSKEHLCDPKIVEDIKFIIKNSKQCPSCKIRIAKLSGCDHMWCPNCKTSFDYSTGKAKKYSYEQPEQLMYRQKGYQYTLKSTKKITDEEKNFLIWGDRYFSNRSNTLDKLKYDFVKGKITSEIYEKNICNTFEKDYIKNLSFEWYNKVKKYIFEDSDSDSELDLWYNFVSKNFPSIKLKIYQK